MKSTIEHRRRKFPRGAVWMGVAAAACLCVAPAPAKDLKVLMIGNSFSICVLKQWPAVAAAAGDRLDLASLYIGGCPLDRHSDNIDRAGDPAFLPYAFSYNYASVTDQASASVAKLGKKTNIPQALAADRWDVVTIQQASGKSPFAETYEPYAGKIVAKIRELAPQAEIVVQETWSYSPYDPRLAKWKMTPADMHAALRKAYRQLAAHYGFRVIPVGDAVQLFRTRLPVSYESVLSAKEIAALKEPDVPKFFGDVVGRSSWQTTKKEGHHLAFDRSHLNPQGHYLQALVWQAKLFGTDVTAVGYRPDYVTEANAKLMRRCAMDAVRDDLLSGK